MSAWQWVVGLVLVLHGVGQLLGVLARTRLGTVTWNVRSRLLEGAVGEQAAAWLSTLVWGAAFVLFVVAGLAVLGAVGTQSSWRALAVAGAIVSLLGMSLFWNAFPVLIPNKIGSLAVNAAVLVGVLIADWPTEAMLTG